MGAIAFAVALCLLRRAARLAATPYRQSGAPARRQQQNISRGQPMAEPISRDDVLNAVEYLKGDRARLADFGIQLSVWLQKALCSTHGVIQRMEVTNGE